jgi:hypothetical protein
MVFAVFAQLFLKGTSHAIEHPGSLLNPLYLSYFLGAAAVLAFASFTRAL